MASLLNIACGKIYHNDWINVDFHADSTAVKKINILGGLPFRDGSIDVVYCSHFLEHLNHDQSISVLSEAKRILVPNGILRIVVPDLENSCREYLKVLEDVGDNPLLDQKYQWVIIELLDQLVRVKSGGKMADFFRSVSASKNRKIADYILGRTGDDLTIGKDNNEKRVITVEKVKYKILYMYLKCVRLLIPKNLRDLIFINTSIGERHQWMYDKYSLSKIFFNLGFKDITIKEFNESEITNFNDYCLDIKKDGTSRKGVSSLYIEAKK